jgi:hypothetical protein
MINLNKNKSIPKNKNITKNEQDANFVLFDESNVNIINSRSNLKIKSLTKKNKSKTKSKTTSKTKSKTKSKNNKQKRTINTNFKDNIEFPQGNNYKCIGPCYPANVVYYHPLTLQAIRSKSNSCPIRQIAKNNGIKIKDKCTLNEDYDYENYDMFADIVQMATSDNVFLEQIYNIKSIYDVELFLENNIIQLPILSQKRILNSIYKVYRDNDSFPSNNFVSLVKKILVKNYDYKIKSKKIITKIMDNKHNVKWKNLFFGIIE